MTCPDENEVAALFEGGLSGDERSRMEAHLGECSACARLLAGMAAMAAPREETVSDTLPARAVAVPRGTLIGRYVVLSLLGAGGMGVVVAAYDAEIDRKVAVKLVRADALEGVPPRIAQTRLLREARTMAKVSHPNVAQVFDVGTHEDRVFLAMELVEGTTLSAWLARRPRGWRDVLRTFMDAGRGLAAAHAAGVIHRDFKPSNVLIGDGGQVKVADFGLARAIVAARAASEAGGTEETASASPHASTATGAGAIVGTPAYMAPEQRRGEDVDARSDQYSFCIAFYEALYGARPSKEARARTDAAGQPVPPWLHAAVTRGSADRPEDRHPTMDALLDAVTAAPRRLERRRALATVGVAAGVVIAAAAWVGARVQQEPHALVCKGAERKLSGVWDAARRDAIAASFARTGAPFAAAAAKSVAAAFDRYARDWSAMHGDACEATRIRGEQSEAVLDLRVRCLERRLSELRALGDIFEHGDREVVAAAAGAAQRLSDLGGCSAARVRSARGSIGGKVAPIEPALADALGRAAALRYAGKFEEAVRAATSARDSARAANEPEVEAEALAILGQVDVEREDGARAEAHLFEALVIAERSGLDALVARAATALAYARSGMMQRYEYDEKWLGLAEAAIQRLGGDDRLSAELGFRRGQLLWRAGRYREALEEHRKAIRFAEEKLPHDTLQRERMLGGLALALMDLGENDEAESCLRRELDIAERESGPEHPRVMITVSNLGLVEMDRGRYTEAAILLERARGLALRDSDDRWASINASVLADALAKLRRTAEARALIGQALALARSAPDYEDAALGHLYGDLANVDRLDKKYDDARANATRAVALFTRAGAADHPEAAGALDILGRILLERGEPAKALEPLEHALRILEKGKTPADHAEVQLALAQALWQSGKDRERARLLAEEAEGFYASTHSARRADVKEIERWFQENGGPLERSRFAP